jgi:flagellin
MESDVAGFKAIKNSLSLGESSVAVARNATESITDLLTDIKSKIVAAQEENVDRAKIQTDIGQLRDQITSIVNAAQFNGLNLIKGTDDVNILSSLDRAADGTVTSSNITVNRQDMTTEAGVFGTALNNTDSAAFATVGTGTTNSATMRATTGSTLQLNITAANANAYTVTINGRELIYTSDADATTQEIRDGLAAMINALDIEGLELDVSNAAQLTLRNSNAFEQFTVSATSDTPANLVTNNVNGVTAGISANGDNTLVQRATTLNFLNSAEVREGRGFQVTVGTGNTFTYVAGKGEDMEDVARGLKAAIDSGNVTGLTTEVQYNADTEQWSLAVDDAETGGQTLTIVANDGRGEASGGLFGLDSIDVTTDEGAAAALANIETMIQAGIDASAAFGSAQSRVETQSEFVSKLTDSLKAGIGTMVDADLEEASARLQALQVQQQLGIQSLSIANQAPQTILALFR